MKPSKRYPSRPPPRKKGLAAKQGPKPTNLAELTSCDSPGQARSCPETPLAIYVQRRTGGRKKACSDPCSSRRARQSRSASKSNGRAATSRVCAMHTMTFETSRLWLEGNERSLLAYLMTESSACEEFLHRLSRGFFHPSAPRNLGCNP
jgi:hypothetical protein